MKPRLVAVAGLLKDTTFTLSDEGLTIGRDPSNSVCIKDVSVSARHCALKVQNGHVHIYDLSSREGTFVNGVPVRQRILDHGDRIAIGDSLFTLLLETSDKLHSLGSVEFDDDEIVIGAQGEGQPADGLTISQEQFLSNDSSSWRYARDLRTLLNIATGIVHVRDLEAMQWQMVGLLFDVVPADLAAVLLAGSGQEDFSSVVAWNRMGPGQKTQINRSIVFQVLRDGIGRVALSAGHKRRRRSMLCVPLMVLKRILGLIYVEAADSEVLFDGEHLRVTAAVAGVASLALDNLRYFESLENENRRLKSEINLEHNMVGESARIREVYRTIAKVAGADSTVLVDGESGTGKELVARAIHLGSPRARKPFVAINCAALTESLLENELFGHERGAFTGAVSQAKGQLEAAEGGTVFLDEVAELAPSLQAKLLRVIQEREFVRVGGTRTIQIDVRLVTATNKDLLRAVEAGTFREDLFYRLNVVSIRVPPLRERREDISLLAYYFLKKYNQKCKRRVQGISSEAMSCLAQHEWPGNVRELENAIERAVVLGAGDLILPEDLPEAVLEARIITDPSGRTYHHALKDLKEELIVSALHKTNGSYTEAAKILNLHPNYLHRLIRNLGLKPALQRLA